MRMILKNPDLPRDLTERTRTEVLESIAQMFLGAERRIVYLVRSGKLEFSGEEMEFFRKLMTVIEESMKTFKPGTARQQKSDLATVDDLLMVIANLKGVIEKSALPEASKAVLRDGIEKWEAKFRGRQTFGIDWDRPLAKLSGKGGVSFEPPQVDEYSSKLADWVGKPEKKKRA